MTTTALRAYVQACHAQLRAIRDTPDNAERRARVERDLERAEEELYWLDKQNGVRLAVNPPNAAA